MNTCPWLRGVSLVELLVVVTIIVVLAAILMPLIGLVKESARTVECLSRKRQVFLALSSYAQDNRNFLPFGKMPGSAKDYWYKMIVDVDDASTASGDVFDKSGIIRMFLCSQDRRSPQDAELFALGRISIGYNHQGVGGDVNGLPGLLPAENIAYKKPARLAHLGSPSKTILVADSAPNSDGQYKETNWRIDANAPYGGVAVHPNHRNGQSLVVLLGDGRTEAMQARDSYDGGPFYQSSALGVHPSPGNADTMWDRR